MHNLYLLTTNFHEILFRILRQVSQTKKQNRTDWQKAKQILLKTEVYLFIFYTLNETIYLDEQASSFFNILCFVEQI